MFSIVFDHVNACASMRWLVKIHNTCPIVNQLGWLCVKWLWAEEMSFELGWNSTSTTLD